MKLHIEQLKVFAKIGDCHWEKVIKQRLIIDIEVEVNKVVDYCTICHYIKDFVVIRHYHFIEELTELLFTALKEEFSFKYCKVKLMKFGCITNANNAAIVIED